MKRRKSIAQKYRNKLVLLGLMICAIACMTGPAFAAEADRAAIEAETPAATENEPTPATNVKAPIVNYGIPVVTLDIDESRGTIKAMNESEDHSVHCYGTLSIQVPEGFHYVDMPDAACESVDGLAMDIRGRGNTTWTAKKKPYKIKLDSKADLFGLGKNKHWVLVANAFDPSLLRDRISGWLGDKLGFEFTPRGVPVDLVMNGKYLGSYYFSENVRVDKNRLNIDELTAKDTEEPEITGGYLVQNGVQTEPDSPNLFFTRYGQCWAVDTPSFDPADGGYENAAQKQYILGYIQDVEDALHGADFTNAKGQHYRDLMDLESAAKYWLVDQACMNGDGYGTGSTYIYKKRGSDKLYWGPLWDFDFAWDNGGTVKGFQGDHDWVKAMLRDREKGGFVEQVHAYWPQVKAAMEEMAADGGVIDQYYQETKRSAKADRKVNPVADRGKKYKNNTYADDVAVLKSWIKRRAAWLDQNFSQVDKLSHRITYMNGDEVFATKFVADGGFIDFPEGKPRKEGHTFMGWKTADGEDIELTATVNEDQTIYAAFLPDDQVTHGKDILMPMSEDIKVPGDFDSTYQIQYTVVPEDAQDQEVTWTSSDESIATVDNNGQVTAVGYGTVTLTGSLKYGETRTFTLHVQKDKVSWAEDLTLENQVFNLSVGEYAQIRYAPAPSNALVDELEWKSVNEKVAETNQYGTLYAMAPGRTKVRVCMSIYSPKGLRKIRKTAVVNVSEGTQENVISCTGGSVAVKRSAVKKKALTIPAARVLGVQDAKGRLTYQLLSVSRNGKPAQKKLFKVNAKAGSVKVKKGLKKGTYQLMVRVQDAGTAEYRPATAETAVMITVK